MAIKKDLKYYLGLIGHIQLNKIFTRERNFTSFVLMNFPEYAQMRTL